MPTETRIVAPGRSDRTVRANDQEIPVPDGWELLPPGDAGLTRRVKSGGPTWTVKQKKGRRTFSLGVWAPADRIAAVRADLATERSEPAYAKRQAAAAKRRDKKQANYVGEFHLAVLEFLRFDADYSELAERLATAVVKHATPVGSGTVARTQRIPVAQRAEAAVIAWLRHQTTAYDNMKIPRVKGKRREVRRMLAETSRLLLENYRQGNPIDLRRCPLGKALGERRI